MKKLMASLLALSCFVSIVSSQTISPIRRPAVGLSFFLNDFQTAGKIRSSSIYAVLRDKSWAKFRDMSPGLALSYFKGLSPHVDFAGTAGFSFVDYPFRNRSSFGNDYLLIEADASANFKMVDENYWVIPYISAGLGAHMFKVYYGAFVPVGLGLRVNLFDEAGLYINTQYRVPITYETANYHFYHSIGIYGAIGKEKVEEVKVIAVPAVEPPKDTDGDGITDDKDKCPTVPGVAKYDGCPVPDTDNDGINDDNDKCPTVPGVARYQGCPIPDTDKDGINDEEDKCPSVPGVARYQGCPVPDTDGDGINDEEDKCPQLAGTRENQGCPEITEEIRKKLDFAASNIYFATGSFKLLAKSNKGLNDVVNILKANPTMKLSIDGHTDNVGKPDKNQVLSQSRADAVKNYLVSKGVDASRLASSGHGQDLPIASNKTAAGRQKNRRVELKLGYY